MGKECVKCGLTKVTGDFEKGRNTCRVCRKESKKIHPVICGECERDFLSIKKDTKYCSLACTGKSRRTKRILDTCSYCEEEISYLKQHKKWEYHYCNQSCRSKHLKTLVSGELNPNWNRVEKRCDGCSKQIKVKPFDLKNTKRHFCSNECYKENIGRFYSGKNNSNWNHNLTKEEREANRRYPAYYKWRENVYKRDGFACKKCGDNTGGNLIAHHIENYSQHKEKRTLLSNGITLCEDCHINFHKEYGYQNNNKKQLLEYI